MQKHARMLAEMRQLCCMQLPQALLIPEFLRFLGQCVPSLATAAVFLDDSGNVERLYSDNLSLLRAGRQFAEEHANSKDEEAAWGHGNLTQFVSKGTVENAWYVDSIMTRSHYYNQVVRPFGIRHQMRAGFHTKTGVSGALFLARDVSAGRYLGRDEAILSSVLPYLRHSANDIPRDDSVVALGDEGLIITDLRGTIRHMDQRAEVLLSLAGNGRFDISPTIEDIVMSLAQDLALIRRGQRARPPQRHLHASAGTFVFRGRWLSASRMRDDDLVAIGVRQLVPTIVKAASAMRFLPLSERQRQVCLGIVDGKTFAQIATHLKVSESTAIDYARTVYEKLDVHSRDQLKARLLDSVTLS